MSTFAIRIPCHSADHQILSAMLFTEAVEGIEELDDGLVVFIESDKWEDEKAILERICAPFQRGPMTIEEIQDQNWNAEWEKTFKPVNVGGFWIRPTWNHDPTPEGHIEIIVDPKMSFGTGYHESTRLMLGALKNVLKEGDRVLDAGTGTGVLAFAALKLGAARADAFDYDPICKENSLENAALNDLSDRYSVQVGTEEVVVGQDYDVVMANINREALRSMLPALKDLLAPHGKIGLAGLLTSDRDVMLGVISDLGMSVVSESNEGEWWSVWAGKGSE